MEKFLGEPEVFWVGLSAIFSSTGFVVLFLYTLYTRRMMKAAEDTRRLSLTPHLVAGAPAGLPGQLEILNVAAPAVNCNFWAQTVNDYTLQPLRVRKPKSLPGMPMPAITSAQPLRIPMQFPEARQVLYVLDCFDTAGGPYQLQVLQTPVGIDSVDIQCMFSIPTLFAPPWTLLRHKIRSWRLLRIWKRTQNMNYPR
jgi:hypothetical protein